MAMIKIKAVNENTIEVAGYEIQANSPTSVYKWFERLRKSKGIIEITGLNDIEYSQLVLSAGACGVNVCKGVLGATFMYDERFDAPCYSANCR